MCRDIIFFVGTVSETFVCSIGLGILEKPISTPCGHTFCEECVNACLKLRHECPLDRKPLLPNQLFKVPLTDETVGALEVYCDYKGLNPNQEGCVWQGRWSDLQEHLKICPFDKTKDPVWRLYRPGKIPEDALACGTDGNNEDLFIARTRYNNGVHPGKIGRHQKKPHFGYGGRECALPQGEVLCGLMAQFSWVVCTTGQDIPAHAFKTGHEMDGRPLFSARAILKGTKQVGKTGHHFGGALIGFSGIEHIVAPFEVLCLKLKGS